MSQHNERIIEKIKEILTSCRQNTLVEGVVADLIDDIPIVGGLTNLFRIADAIQKNDEEALILQSGDFIIPMVPFIGKVIDDISMVNTYLTYEKLKKEGKINIDVGKLIKEIK